MEGSIVWGIHVPVMGVNMLYGQGQYINWAVCFCLSFLTNRKRETCEFDSRSIHVPQSLSMLERLMAVPLNYEMLESRCINVPKSRASSPGKPQTKQSESGSN